MSASHPQSKLWLSLAALTAAFVAAGVLLSFVLKGRNPASTAGDPFLVALNNGRTYYENNEATRAIEWFQQALALQPNHPDARLNLANACRLANQPDQALVHSLAVLQLNPNDAAAHYVAGCAQLRLRNFAAALQSLQTAKAADPTVNPVTFQIARAHHELGQFEDAVAAFQEFLQFDPDHPSATYLLGQSLLRAGRRDEANATLQRYQQLMAGKPATAIDPATLEQCRYTQIRAPFVLAQPTPNGIAVRFADSTAQTFAGNAAQWRGPVGVLDYNHDGRNGLFALQPGAGFRTLVNSNGVMVAAGEPLPLPEGRTFTKCLVGDLQNDRFEDVVVLGPQGSLLFKLATNAQASDSTTFSRLHELPAADGVLADLDFTGKLDLLTVAPDGASLRLWRNLGGLYFKDISATSGIPANLGSIQSLVIDDWNNDDMADLIALRAGAPPAFLLKQRGGPLALTNTPPQASPGRLAAAGDLDNDLHVDLVTVTARGIECAFQGRPQPVVLSNSRSDSVALTVLDYDNDGWLDVLASSPGAVLQVWRNLGSAGFKDTTQDVGARQLANLRGPARALHPADLDNDGDTDLVLDLGEAGLASLRNDGGHANQQLKLRLLGNRSNASGLGVRVELTSGLWRTARTVTRLPIEIGVGQNSQIGSLTVRWFDLALNSVDVAVQPTNTLPLIELQLPTGSCPYLYAWDGTRFRFVTDLLGAAPLGLPVAENRLIQADPDEIVLVGDDTNFKPRDGRLVIQITEELREVLYLDHARLLTVDHPVDHEVHPTSKLLPGPPFPNHRLLALHNRQPLRQALRQDGLDVTRALQEIDGDKVSPVRQRIPQLRGLAEPFHVTLDFGPLDSARPLVLALNGWLRFGGGMANIAASHHPDLPFPFPTLEAELPSGNWQAVDVRVGAPAGKTKTIVVELQHRLPPGSRRLRLTTAFEIHWDRIALLERAADDAGVRIREAKPLLTDLHWRGFSRFEDRPWTEPLTPDYTEVTPYANWRITPAGWCTRYGEVGELLDARDNALVLLNGGDELTLEFEAPPAPPPGVRRQYFLVTSGWDKDADFHVRAGTRVEPLPWHGLDDQEYGRQPRPAFPNDSWIPRYNTRWVGPFTLQR